MSNELSPESHPDEPMVYQIGIRSHLGRHWAEWFEGLTITLEEDGNTLLTGTVIDQAALHGLLKKVRDLDMPLLSVNGVNPGQKKCQLPNRLMVKILEVRICQTIKHWVNFVQNSVKADFWQCRSQARLHGQLLEY